MCDRDFSIRKRSVICDLAIFARARGKQVDGMEWKNTDKHPQAGVYTHLVTVLFTLNSPCIKLKIGPIASSYHCASVHVRACVDILLVSLCTCLFVPEMPCSLVPWCV